MTTRRIPSLRDFSGGLNLRDAQPEIPLNDLADAVNVTLDEHGGVSSRLGYSKFNGTPFAAAKVSNVFYWEGQGAIVTQCGASLYLNASLVSFKTFTTSARCGMAEFGGKLCIIHPVDGFFTYDTVVVTAIATGPKGDSLAPWQNKLWTNDKSGANPSRVHWCAVGDPTTWNVGDVNDIRDVDGSQVVNVFSGQGQDIKGAAGLLVFKQQSTYRINDSTTGAYTTIDLAVGAASSLSVVSVLGRILVLSPRGVFQTDGVSGLVSVSDKLAPIWSPASLAYNHLDLFCAGAAGDRAYFSVPTLGQAANNIMFEYHPIHGWFTSNSNAASCYTLYTQSGNSSIVTGSPSINGQVYVQLSGGSDDGATISAYWRTGWVVLNDGLAARLNRLRVTGRGSFSLFAYRDYQYDPADLFTAAARALDLTLATGYFATQKDVYSLKKGRAFSFYFVGGSTTTVLLPAQWGQARQVGAWSVQELDLDAVPLGRV